jgi:hypothetical protein
VKLTLKNRAQPFLKLELPPGATVLSSDVAGEIVKPVLGADGSRVPLLRPGFRPTGDYEVSFVFQHAGAPFAKKGGAELALPKMDIPIGNLQWEVFLPEQYKVANFGGDALAAHLFPSAQEGGALEEPTFTNAGLRMPTMIVNGSPRSIAGSSALVAGQVGGVVVDSTGAVIGGARVEIRNVTTGALLAAIADPSGNWAIRDIPSGRLQITTSVPGFKTTTREMNHDAGRSTRVDGALEVGNTSESVTVTAEASLLKTESGSLSYKVNLGDTMERSDLPRQIRAPQVLPQVASVNVQNFQQRVAGILPIAVNVPRAGNSYQFVRPLVMDEVTNLTFKYKVR